MPPTRALLACIAATFPVAGLLGAASPATALPALAVGHGLAVGAFTYSWCRAESLQHHRAPPGRSALMAGVFPLVGVPLYFFRTRPWRQACRDSARAGTFAAALLLLQYLVAELAGVLLP